MCRHIAIAALLLCAQKCYAQLNSQVSNANIRHDSVLEGMYGNTGIKNVVDNINQNIAFNSNPQNKLPFQSLPTNGQISLGYPRLFTSQSNFPQTINVPSSSLQQMALQSPSPLIMSTNYKSSDLQDILKPHEILQEHNLISKLPFNSIQCNQLPQMLGPEGSADFTAEQMKTDLGFNSITPASITVLNSLPPYPNTASSFTLPVPIPVETLLQKHQPQLNILRNIMDSPKLFPNYMTTLDLPQNIHIERPKQSIWKELLPLILNVLKENRQSCGCCQCKCCCKDKDQKVNEPQIYGDLSIKKRNYKTGEDNFKLGESFTTKTCDSDCEKEDEEHDEETEESESEES